MLSHVVRCLTLEAPLSSIVADLDEKKDGQSDENDDGDSADDDPGYAAAGEVVGGGLAAGGVDGNTDKGVIALVVGAALSVVLTAAHGAVLTGSYLHLCLGMSCLRFTGRKGRITTYGSSVILGRPSTQRRAGY